MSADSLLTFLFGIILVALVILQPAERVYPYYSWRAMRKYYMQKLKSFHTGIDMDMHKYLLFAK